MTRTADVTIDDRGWTQAESRPSWKPRDAGRSRRGLSWTSAEDRELLRRVAGARSNTWADPTIQAAAVAHGRSSSAVATRVSALRAGLRLAMTAKHAAKDTTP